ncbi:unnamed protein product [Blepharisma stoltei]|uniref:Uncharacterized protein n=1 Tax=Blepharisma stoltei TaxID=1481888 RepID=A0AAU9JIH2_9CILI|nr:unnamed protein product [Blepharisma stoltei]
MAYELLQNWENIYEISEFNNEKLNLLRKLKCIIYELIQNKKFPNLHEKWAELKVEFSCSNQYGVYHLFYCVFSIIFQNRHNYDLAYCCLKKLISISLKTNKIHKANEIYLKLGALDLINRDLKKTISISKISIKLCKDREDLHLLIQSYIYW